MEGRRGGGGRGSFLVGAASEVCGRWRRVWVRVGVREKGVGDELWWWRPWWERVWEEKEG